MFEIILKLGAESDLDEIFDWYENEKEGLGFVFLNCLDAAIRKLKVNPQYYYNVSLTTRRIPTQKFPYNIYYTIEKDKVYIHAIMHQFRNPKAWKKRLKK
jgi:toxin ParE1/3/4